MTHTISRRLGALLAVLAGVGVGGCVLAALPAGARVPTRSTRPTGPFAHLPPVPSFQLQSTSITNGRPLPRPQLSRIFKVPGGEDQSPQLSWSGAPARTRSYAITMYDPDAPILGGAIQWAVANVSGSTHSLPAGAGGLSGRLLPRGATEVVNEFGLPRYIGGAPQPHTGVHDYYFIVSALNVAHLPVSRSTSVGVLDLDLYKHTIARAIIVCPTSAR